MRVKNKITGLMCAPIALAMLAACASDDELGGTTPEVKGQTLVINATNGGGEGTRVIYGNDGAGNYSVKWDQTNDHVKIFAGSDANTGDFTVSEVSADGHTATLTGTLASELSTITNITGYIYNKKITAVNNGAFGEDGIGKQIQVDYTEQDGTYEDAVSRSVLLGTGTYDPANGNKLKMDFKSYTTFLKLNLNFDDETLTSATADLYLTGEEVLSLSRIHTITTAGSLQGKELNPITVKSVAISGGKSEVYIAMFPRKVKNVKLQAFASNGKVYDFNISNSGEAKLDAGNVYKISRKGVVQTESTTLDGAGTPASPYLINNLADLKLFAKKVNAGNEANKYYKLTSDIIITGDWTPIGTQAKPFKGTFDGDNHTIYGSYKVNIEKNEGAGLFGVTSNATIKNVSNKANIEVNAIDLSCGTGGIVGRALYVSTIENCSNSGKITTNYGSVGGVVGTVYISGQNGKTAKVEACWNEGEITNNTPNTVTSSKGAGGVTGVLQFPAGTTNKLVVRGCYSTNAANISLESTNSSFASGVAGFVSCTIEGAVEVYACWSAATLKGKTQSAIAGGNSSGKFNVHDVWHKKTNNASNVTANVTNDHEGSSNVPETDVIANLNTALETAGSEYKFDDKANIIKK